MSPGITDLSDRDLENLLRVLHRGELVCPITPESAMRGGLAYLSDRLQFFRGLDEAGVRAVLVAVLAERRAQARRQTARGH